LSFPSALAASAGAQNFVIANIGNGNSNTLVYLNGSSSTLAFGDVARRQSKTLPATVVSIGTENLTLGSPYLEEIVNNSAFTIARAGTTCGNGLELEPATTCNINVQFTPMVAGPTTESAVVESNAYNNGTAILNFTGTGAGGGFDRAPRGGEAKEPSSFTAPHGRKSFRGSARTTDDRRDQGTR
jgi:hypothetical protein